MLALRKLRVHMVWLSLVVVGQWACTRKSEEPGGMYLLLYSGIRNLITLGDMESQVVKKIEDAPLREDLRTTSSSDTLGSLGVSHSLFFRKIGTRVYFRENRAVLIEIQDPFRGEIQGKNLKLFALQPPPGTSWDDFLIRQLGPPSARASGGSFGSEGLFYEWGDLSFNRMGPNQIALYHDPEISRYRLNHFGRNIKFFKEQ